MKKSINKYLRIAAIIISSMLIVSLSLHIYIEFTTPKYLETSVKTYSYSSTGSIHYSVFLKPNILYTTPSLEEGGTYITEFIDSIRATFEYGFTGDRQADFTGSYNVTAYVEGFSEEKNQSSNNQGKGEDNTQQVSSGGKVIWKKEYLLIPDTKLEQKGKSITIQKGLSVNYTEYNTFAQKITEISKLNIPTRLVVNMNVKLQADTDKGKVEEEITQSITIPLSTFVFNIVKNELLEKPGSIEENKKIQLPLNKKLLIVYGASALVFTATLLLVIFLTTAKPDVSEYEKALNTIFKKHGSRLVALRSCSPEASRVNIMVRTIDDLIRISDELQKPVLYTHCSDFNNISMFFVYGENLIYLFDLKESINDNEKYCFENTTIINPSTPEEVDIKTWKRTTDV